MARLDLASMFLNEQETVIKEDEARASSNNKSSNSEKTVRFGLSKGEVSKTYLGYFLTAPGDVFSRKIRNIHRFGCNQKTYGTVGFRCMDPEDYVLIGSDPNNPTKGITPEQKTKLKNFINLFAEINKSGKIRDITGGDPLVYFQYIKSLEVFYMYLTDGVTDKDGKNIPGIYLVTTKSTNFMSDRAKWIKTTENLYNNIPGDVGKQYYQNFIMGMVDNSFAKTDKIEVVITLKSGYEFAFKTVSNQTPFVIPETELAEMKNLDTQYIDRYSIDEAELDKNIAILNKFLSEIQGMEAKSQVTADLGNVFKD